jgi:plastocyanin
MPALRPSTRIGSIVAVGLILVLAAAACASPSASPGGSAAASTPPSAAESMAPASEGPSGDTTVNISGRSFGADITISAGSTVTFVNQDGFGHTVTNGENGVAAADALFDESLPDGGTFAFTFDTPGTYLVTCRIHSSMNVAVTVE